MKKQILLLFALLLTGVMSFAQSVGINTDNTAPDNSAMLDVKSANKGLLIPRMTESERDLISSPANGLLIFQTDGTTGFYYYEGSWKLMGENIAETDPVFNGSVAAGISGTDTAYWNDKFDLPALTTGSVLFSNGATVSQDNNNLFWDNTNKHLGIGTGTPLAALEVKSQNPLQTSNILKIVNSNNDSVLTVSGNSADVFIDATVGSFNIWSRSGAVQKRMMAMTPSNCFIGRESGISNTSGYSNIFIGENSGYANQTGYHNVFIGHFSGYSGTALKNNIFIGDSAGYLSNAAFATNNVCIGYAAGKKTQSYNNVYIGNLAGWSNSSGQNNIAIGDKAGYSNLTSQNIFIGTEAGWKNTTGFFNIIMGRWAGHSLTTGSQQIIIGGGAGASLTTGSENIIIGANAGTMNDGDKNIFLGNSAGWSNTGSNNIIMGYKVGYSYFQTVSNRLIIDNSQVAIPLIWGEFDNRRVVINGTNSNNINNRTFFVNGSAGGTGAWWNDSDEKLKKNINTISGALDKVMLLRGVNFEWKDTETKEKGIRMGFIAQEAEKVIPEVVNKEGDYYSMQYAPITALLVEAVKEQQKQIEELHKENALLKSENSEMKSANLARQNEIESMQNEINKIKTSLNITENK